MHLLLRTLTLAAASCAGLWAPLSPLRAATPAAAEVQGLASRVMQDAVQQARFNGAVVLMRDGVVVFEHASGLAQRRPDRPYTTDTPSDGGSLAKTLTAALLHELVAEGRLSLDDLVTRHLPAYPHAQQKVRDLLTHRSGLPDYDFFEPDFKPDQARQTADLLAVLGLRKPPVNLAPGVQVEYSNLGFDLAGLVAEKVTSRNLNTLFRERYFKPLGMDGAFARPALFKDWPVPRSPGYQWKNNSWQLSDSFEGEGFIGGSNVHASARDWARWGDAFARGHVMAAARMEAGLREPMLDSGLPHRLSRLSWYCDGSQQRCHYTGAYNGFFSQVYWDRARREVVAYVSNSTFPPWRCAALTRDLIDALAGRTPVPESVQSPVRIAKKDLPRWAGDYRAEGLGPLRITAQAERAFVRVGQGELASLYPAAPGVLYAPTLDLWLAFSGTPDKPTLHLRSVFDKADAHRVVASSGKP